MKRCPKCDESEKLYEYPFPRHTGSEGVQIIKDCAHCEKCGFDWVVT